MILKDDGGGDKTGDEVGSEVEKKQMTTELSQGVRERER